MSNTIKNNSIEDELDAIRTELYEETKGMSPDERVVYLRKLVAPVHQELDITPIPVKSVKKTAV